MKRDRVKFRESHKASLRLFSVVMLSWKRPTNVYEIVAHLRLNPLVDDILVWNNNPKEKLPALRGISGVQVLHSTDLGLHTRWAASLLTKNDVILMQDDDLLLDDVGISQLHYAYSAEPNCIHTCHGRIITENETYVAKDTKEKEVDIALTRLTMFHRKHVLSFFAAKDLIPSELWEITKQNGEDILFSFAVSQGDRQKIRNHFASLKPHLKKLPEPFAIRARADHEKIRTSIVRECRRLFTKCYLPS